MFLTITQTLFLLLPRLQFTRLLLILPTVPLDLHPVVDSVLVSVHVLEVGEPLATEITGEVPDSEVDSDSVSVEVELSLEFLATICKKIIKKFYSLDYTG